MSKTVALPEGLSPSALRKTCDPSSLGFQSTQDIEPLEGLVGQDRAIDAISLSVAIRQSDFNVFVLGPEGTGRHRAVEHLLSKEGRARSDLADWAYVNNFDAPHKPLALKLPPGSAQSLKLAMEALIDDLANDIPALFESEEYQTERRALEEEFGAIEETALSEFAERAKDEDVALIRTPLGFVLAAIVEGRAIKREEFEALPEEERHVIEQKIERLQGDLSEVLQEAPKREKKHRNRLEKLHSGMAERVVSTRMDDVRGICPDNPSVAAYLDEVHKDIVANAELFLRTGDGENDGPFPDAIRKHHADPEFGRYSVNVMVTTDGASAEMAPTIREELPTLGNLTGRIEHVSQMGALVTNFALIKPGALHAANGGYLVLDARRILTEPFAWDALKRCLLTKEIRIASMSDRLGLVPTVSLEPDPIPIDIRVILIGDRMLYTLLTLFDPDFRKLFRLQADFEDTAPDTPDMVTGICRILSGVVRERKLIPLAASGAARLVDEARRHAQDAQRLSLHTQALSDILCEADHYARTFKATTIGENHVGAAIKAARQRASRIRDRLREAVSREVILIDTTGEVVGQINGLSVMTVSGERFGRPSRITARVRMGKSKLVDIEREVSLGGPLHSKGVLILSSYLSTTYALNVPMSLHASIVFEQSYGGVDGDSASSAELYALLSALSKVPIRQGIAVTGSVNQAGQVQAIGGVNEKIEGFFETCQDKGLDGNQGVLIPQANVEHLMLREDVIDAVKESRFRVIPVRTIDEGIEVLCGRAAGQRSRSGLFPKDSVNGLVEARLRIFAENRREYARHETKGDT